MSVEFRRSGIVSAHKPACPPDPKPPRPPIPEPPEPRPPTKPPPRWPPEPKPPTRPCPPNCNALWKYENFNTVVGDVGDVNGEPKPKFDKPEKPQKEKPEYAHKEKVEIGLDITGPSVRWSKEKEWKDHNPSGGCTLVP